MMNSNERLLTAMALEEPDRVPCAPHVGVGLAQEMPASEWEALRQHTDVTMSVGALSDTQIFGGQYWLDHQETIRRDDEVVTHIDTPKGRLTSRLITTPEASWRAEHLVKGPDDVDKLLSVPYEPPTFDVDAYHTWTEELGNDGLVALGMPSAFRFCLNVFGSQPLYLKIADDLPLVVKLVTLMNERLALYIQACCDKGVRHFWMGGSEHCGPGVANPRLFHQLITPYDKQIVAIIHDHKGTVNLHTHGKLKDILEEIAEIGPDVMSPIETGLRGDVTLADVKAQIGDRVCLKGNLDDMAFLALAEPEEVRQAAERCIAQAAAGGGYILSGTDAGIYHPHWVQSFLVMAEVAQTHTY